MLDIKVIAVFLFFPSLFTLFNLWSACYSFIAIKKSKTARKKLGKSVNFWGKFVLRYPIEADSLYYRKVTALRRIYYVAFCVFFVCVLVFTFTAIFSLNKKALISCVAFKLLVMDIPTEIVAFIMSKHGKSGGIVWRWEE